eukprot:scaffold54375_cov21-Tisochrysis_lutea.AAC.2
MPARDPMLNSIHYVQAPPSRRIGSELALPCKGEPEKQAAAKTPRYAHTGIEEGVKEAAQDGGEDVSHNELAWRWQ